MNENKKAKKVVALLLCAVLLVVGSVTGTMAYLTSKATVTNTFTVGKVAITLDEAKVNAYGEPVDASDNVVILADAPRVAANEYKLVPGHTYVKDPVIHVAAGSEACYLFVKIDNGISGIEGTNTIASQMTANGWTDKGSGFYAKALPVDARNAAQDVTTFGTFTIANTADISSSGTAKIIIKAYAVQADGFTDVDDAWDKAPTDWTTGW